MHGHLNAIPQLAFVNHRLLLRLRTCVRESVSVFARVCVCVHARVFMCVCVCACVCMCVYGHTYTDIYIYIYDMHCEMSDTPPLNPPDAGRIQNRAQNGGNDPGQNGGNDQDCCC